MVFTIHKGELYNWRKQAAKMVGMKHKIFQNHLFTVYLTPVVQNLNETIENIEIKTNRRRSTRVLYPKKRVMRGLQIYAATHKHYPKNLNYLCSILIFIALYPKYSFSKIIFICLIMFIKSWEAMWKWQVFLRWTN